MYTKVIAEIGINHEGSIDKALRLIDHAATAKCWGVKFQFRGEDFFGQNDEMGSTLIREELLRSKLSVDWIATLRQSCHSRGLKFGMSFFSRKDLNTYFDQLNLSLDFIKIPSSEFRNIPLIESAKSRCSQLLISYGGGEEKEIFENITKADLRAEDVVFHCISNYPVVNGNQQLLFIKKLKENVSCRVGYSSHDADWTINLLATALGIDFIERHFCESKFDVGLDISTSSDPVEMSRMISILDSWDEIHQCDYRIPNQGEILNVRNLGTSLYAKRSMNVGHVLQEEDLVEQSPATGILAAELGDILGRKLNKAIDANNPLTHSHVFANSKVVPLEVTNFAINNQLSIPVRLHDFELLKVRFPIRRYELHFSYKEIDHLMMNGIDSLISLIIESDEISIHLPDYINKDNLISPFNSDQEVAKKSLDIIDFCVHLAKVIEQKTKKNCYILGSFSMSNGLNKEEFYQRFAKYQRNIFKTHGISIFAQWLPKMAWYFGGSVKVDLFSSREDIAYCLRHEIPLCLDIAHLILSANYFEEDWYEWFQELCPITNHIHLSDAVGIDGEGVEFGKGDIHSLRSILDMPMTKVLEIWEGHLNDGVGFLDALYYLRSTE